MFPSFGYGNDTTMSCSCVDVDDAAAHNGLDGCLVVVVGLRRRGQGMRDEGSMDRDRGCYCDL